MSKRILVVEDEELTLGHIQRLLKRAGYEVVPARDGQTALQLFVHRNAHLVLLDLMLPGMSGWQVFRRLRRRSAVPIIILTARSARDDLAKALLAGADAYVVKPFNDWQLLARVEAVLGRSRTSPPLCLLED